LINILENSAIGKGLKVKINCVLMRGVNDEEVSDFINLILDVPIDVRFIELMPFEDNNWDKGKLITYYEILQKLEDKVMCVMN
jgi:cyclic pyranopterin phosphate synthase